MAESRRYYHGGKTLVVDRLVELKRSGSVERMKSSLGIAMNQRELDRLRNELENMGADGVISPAEKQSLKREWGNLESSYYKTSGQFSDDPDLSGSAPWALLAPAFATLSSIMEKVLADMDSSYTDADLAQIDDLFYSCWTYINRCSALYDSRSSFGSRYELRFVGNREFNGSTTINVVVYSKTLGQNVAFPASEFDWFYKFTDRILENEGSSSTYAPSLGGNYPIWVNSGQMDNRGFDMTVGWTDSFANGWSYGLTGMLSWSRNRVLNRKIADDHPEYRAVLGQPLDQLYGFEATGLFQTQEQIDNYTTAPTGTLNLGDIMYRDVNGDGIISSQYDYVRIGYAPTPEMVFSLNMEVGWKNIMLSALWQGAALCNYSLTGVYGNGNCDNTMLLTKIAEININIYSIIQK